jgi:hypothetical protein
VHAPAKFLEIATVVVMPASRIIGRSTRGEIMFAQLDLEVTALFFAGRHFEKIAAIEVVGSVAEMSKA